MKGSLLGGWEFSGITLIESGLPLTPTLSSDNVGLGGDVTSRPDLVTALTYPKKVTQWFNTAAFAAPAPLSFGSAGEGDIIGPGRWNFNISLFKSFRMSFPGNPEGARLEFRSEFFNTFNHTQFHDLNTTYGASAFGQVVDTYDPRVIQLGLKFLF